MLCLCGTGSQGRRTSLEMLCFGEKMLLPLLPLVALLLKGVAGSVSPVMVHRRMGDDIVLPCGNLFTTSSSAIVTWTFYHGSLSFPTLQIDGRYSRRLFVTQNCSLVIRDLRSEDVGTYKCRLLSETFAEVFLTVLAVSSSASVADLRPGRSVALSCTLYTYYDDVSCGLHNRAFNISWTSEDGTNLSLDPRFEVKVNSPCNVTLVKELESDDLQRRWRCQVILGHQPRFLSVDFYPSFVFQNGTSVQCPACSVPLPISRILLCALLPAMVLVVCWWTWRLDHRKTGTP